MSQASQAPPKSAASAPVRPGDALPEGARLGEFEIRRVLGAGGFGIVYGAWDHALEREVALKEYLPVTLAGRGPDYRVTIRASSHEETFALGLRSFVNEARLLARFDHPSLLKVYRFWEDNGTAYMAMPLYHGRTLRQVRQAMAPGSPGEAWARTLVEPMLAALEKLHTEGVFHRDIAPDNILMTDDGRPVLLDFGAARRVIGDRTHALTAILKPHFAPIEQYADVSSVRQGPWTDLYGLAATVYYLLVGQPPLPAAARAIHDELVPLARLQPANCSLAFLQAIDWAMAVRPAERPQSAAIWRDVLEGRIDPPRRLQGDITAPGVTTRAVMQGSILQTDFDPTRPIEAGKPQGPPASSSAAHASSREAGSWSSAAARPHPADAAARGQPVTVPHREAPPGAPAARAPVAHEVLPATYPLAAVPVRALRRPRQLPPRWWLWSGTGGALALVAAFTWVVSSQSPASGAAEAAPASAAAVGASAPRLVQAGGVPAVPAATLPVVTGPVAAAPASALAAADVVPSAAPPASEAAPAPIARALPARPRHPARETRRRAAAVESASARCAGRNFLSRLICMKHECDTDPRAHADPACVKMHREEEERRQALANH